MFLLEWKIQRINDRKITVSNLEKRCVSRVSLRCCRGVPQAMRITHKQASWDPCSYDAMQCGTVRVRYGTSKVRYE
ncbi:hypothetical protein M0804_010858 [Polistes exclamans]|nr:hypothetical protein M0804_010858 [Polistes exclamans]